MTFAAVTVASEAFDRPERPGAFVSLEASEGYGTTVASEASEASAAVAVVEGPESLVERA